jgi:hypothetical protein
MPNASRRIVELAEAHARTERFTFAGKVYAPAVGWIDAQANYPQSRAIDLTVRPVRRVTP